MGSRATPDLPPTEAPSKRQLHVLVTGFGPFGSNTQNPSHPIALSLPPTLLSHPHLTIQIHAHPSPIRVSYAVVRDLIPRLLFSSAPNNNNNNNLQATTTTSETTTSPPSPSNPQEIPSTIYDTTPASPRPPPPPSPPSDTDTKACPPPMMPANSGLERPVFDIVLFIGMAGRRTCYAVESQAHRDGYQGLDVDGHNMIGDRHWTTGAFQGCPEVLASGFDVLGERQGGKSKGVWERWRERVGDLADVRTSTDAGHYLCDFIYFTGLAEYWRRSLIAECPVVFLHVPGEMSEEHIARGGKVTEGLIQALAEEWWEKKKQEETTSTR